MESFRRQFVELELSKRFYNHTAVALHDWETYSQLAAMAKHSFRLSIAEPDLPGSGIDPGTNTAGTPVVHGI